MAGGQSTIVGLSDQSRHRSASVKEHHQKPVVEAAGRLSS